MFDFDNKIERRQGWSLSLFLVFPEQNLNILVSPPCLESDIIVYNFGFWTSRESKPLTESEEIFEFCWAVIWNLLFGGVTELVFSPSIVAFLHPCISPEVLCCLVILLLKSRYIFGINCSYVVSPFLRNREKILVRGRTSERREGDELRPAVRPKAQTIKSMFCVANEGGLNACLKVENGEDTHWVCWIFVRYFKSVHRTC